MSIDFKTAFVLSAAIYGFLLSVSLFLSNAGNHVAKKFIGALVFTYSVSLLNYLIFLSGSVVQYAHLAGSTFPLFFLIGPFFLLYVQSLNDSSFYFKPIYTFYFIPYILWQLYFSYIYMLPVHEKLKFISSFVNGEAQLIPILFVLSHLLTNIGFVFLSYRYLGQLENQLYSMCSNSSIEKIKWTKVLTFLFLVVVVYNLIAFCLTTFTTINFFSLEFIGTVGLICIILAVGMHVINQPLLYANIDSALLKKRNHGKYKTSPLDKDKIDKIKQKIGNYMEENKPYLNPNLKISDLSNLLDLPTHYLSQVINQEFGTNFFEFINAYRVEEAKDIIRDNSNGDFKLIKVAFDSGFNSKSSFNRVFKKHVQLTPSQFRRKVL